MRVIGTAGHVDHGKSTLVKALTGIDPDPLRIQQAKASFPKLLQTKVEFHNLSLDDFAAQAHTDQYDLAILSWSL